MKVLIPPIKSQGIKTKLVPWIAEYVSDDFDGTWIEPFMGTGVVAFNLAPKKALLCDTNPHLIRFYQAISDKKITAAVVRDYLNLEGSLLLERGEEHYYAVRNRFNQTANPLDFLFLNRAGFNGMIRFNKKGEFNIPFCRKPNRFAQAYITKIVNQVDTVAKILVAKEFRFVCQSFEQTIQTAQHGDIIYCDPPYIDRHTDYFNAWTEHDEYRLHELLTLSPAQFILSTWHYNDYRSNEYIGSLWQQFTVRNREHFYHVGAKEKNRNPMVEAIVSNFSANAYPTEKPMQQLRLLETASTYK
ncbi:Dam family site-specific DNA-(adenine-N6)-methyltransferase [Neisseria sp.]|uniref:DNA adenine methylase n=1 Tax=Neisseria sp. TaxID=192066 RepID=UPI00289883E0|nr:Dam family site-specific DNA-(adenine-N6)-methyltransferase [Neisseria sp.]